MLFKSSLMTYLGKSSGQCVIQYIERVNFLSSRDKTIEYGLENVVLLCNNFLGGVLSVNVRNIQVVRKTKFLLAPSGSHVRLDQIKNLFKTTFFRSIVFSLILKIPSNFAFLMKLIALKGDWDLILLVAQYADDILCQAYIEVSLPLGTYLPILYMDMFPFVNGFSNLWFGGVKGRATTNQCP